MRTSTLRSVVSAVLVIALVGTSVPALDAQSAAPPPGATVPVPVTENDSVFEAGRRAGEAEAGRVGTGGKAALGALAGISIYGTLGVFAIGPAPLTVDVFESYSKEPPEFQRGFKEGWNTKSRSKKRRSFLIGAVTGFVSAFVLAAVMMGDDVRYEAPLPAEHPRP